jgi:hypothetical protein
MCIGGAADEVFDPRSRFQEWLQEEQSIAAMGNIQRERVDGRVKNLTSVKVLTDRDISEKAHDLRAVLDDPSDWPIWNSFVTAGF